MFRLFDCTGLSRVDTFVTDAGEVLINEINTLPGFTPPRRTHSCGRSRGSSTRRSSQSSSPSPWLITPAPTEGCSAFEVLGPTHLAWFDGRQAGEMAASTLLPDSALRLTRTSTAGVRP